MNKVWVAVFLGKLRRLCTFPYGILPVCQHDTDVSSVLYTYITLHIIPYRYLTLRLQACFRATSTSMELKRGLSKGCCATVEGGSVAHPQASASNLTYLRIWSLEFGTLTSIEFGTTK